MDMVLLCGLPGSGKTTLAKEEFPCHTRISQDELGSRGACVNAVVVALRAGEDVIIDRTNINSKQRETWIKLAQDYGCEKISCMVFWPNPEQSIDRIHERLNHETITKDMPLEKKRRIVYDFNQSFEMPSINEGFMFIGILKDIKDIMEDK